MVGSILTSTKDVQEQIVNRFKIFVFDMDGVVWHVDDPICGAKEALEALVKKGKHIFFVTNNSMLKSEAFIEKLSRLQLGNFPSSCVLGSSWAAAQCLRKTKFQGKVYMIGPPALKEELQKIPGITIIDSSIHNSICVTPREFLNYEIDTTIGAIVMGFDQHLNYFKIAYTTALINHNPEIHLIFTNADHQFPTKKWILPGNGAFISPITVATGKQGIIAGKPEATMIQEILHRHPYLIPSDICMIGDNLTTDIPFGNKNGLTTVLVETGVHNRHDLLKFQKNSQEYIPHYILPSISLFSDTCLV